MKFRKYRGKRKEGMIEEEIQRGGNYEVGYWNVKYCLGRSEGKEGNTKQRNQHIQNQIRMKHRYKIRTALPIVECCWDIRMGRNLRCKELIM